MKKKKIFLTILITALIGCTVYSIILHIKESNSINNETSEFTPTEEISNEQLRETILTLYFLDIQGSTIKSEGRLIDSNQLLENPYKLIVQYLLDGPKSEGLQSVFPENVQLLEANIENNCVVINFSQELLNYKDETQKYNIINCLLNSLTQLNEVNSIKILINGDVSPKFNEQYNALY